jgi:hypothetical protein
LATVGVRVLKKVSVKSNLCLFLQSADGTRPTDRQADGTLTDIFPQQIIIHNKINIIN